MSSQSANKNDDNSNNQNPSNNKEMSDKESDSATTTQTFSVPEELLRARTTANNS